MRKYLYIFLGGAAGGLVRAMAVRAEDIFAVGGMDCTIMLVNISGAFLLGLFLSGTARFVSMSPGVHLGVAVGFFGSFTTFSTLAMEGADLLQAGQTIAFAIYIAVSCLAGLSAAGIGSWVGAGKGVFRFGGLPDPFAWGKAGTEAVTVPVDEREDD